MLRLNILRHSQNAKGFALIQVMIACAIFLVIVLTTFQVTLMYKRSLTSEKRNDKTIQVLLEKMLQVRGLEFTDLVNYCAEKKILGKDPRFGTCVVDSALNTKSSTNPIDIRIGLERTLGENGRPATGIEVQSCVEVVLCKPMGGGHLLEVTLNQYYLSAPEHRLVTRSRIFRRTKW